MNRPLPLASMVCTYQLYLLNRHLFIDLPEGRTLVDTGAPFSSSTTGRLTWQNQNHGVNKGGYFGGRLLRYMPAPIDTQRFSFGMGTLGVVMAAVNYLVATYLSKDMWLYYTSFGDFVLSMVMVFAVIKYATIEER